MLVVHTEETHNPGHIFRLPNMVTHDTHESSPERLRLSLGDQLVVDLPREHEVRHAGIVDVAERAAAELVGDRW